MEDFPENITVSRSLSEEQHYVIGVYLIFIGVLGTIGNILILLVFAKFKVLRTPTNTVLVSLAVSDMGMCLFGYPFSAASSIAKRWLFGRSGCLWYAACGMLFGIASIGNLTLISIDRYIMACRYQTYIRLKYRHYFSMEALVWGNASFWSIIPLLGWARYGLEPSETACVIDWRHNDGAYISYVIILTIASFGLPLGVIAYCYVKACRFIRSIGDGGDQESPEWINQKQVTKMSIIAIIFFLLAWLPFAILCLWAAFGNPSDIPVTLSVTPALFAKSSAFYNPLIYVTMNERFRLAIGSLFTKTRSWRQIEALRLHGLL